MDGYEKGDLVWFDPGINQVLPGEVVEFNRSAQVVTVQAVISNQPETFTITNMTSVRRRQDLGQNGVEDMIDLIDLNEASLLWNLKIRYDKEMIYTYTGSILVAVNPYKMSDIYGLDMVKKYEGKILGSLPPHLFAIGSSAYSNMNKDNESQCVVISGESGAGKTESTKLIMQYLAAVNKSSSNLITEQILEASPLLESFGNAKTVRNDNSSRFGKYVEVFFKDGVITGARTTKYLLEKSRIVTQAQDERNYHVFYELLVGLSDKEKKKYGLQTADDYFYLNQGGATDIEGKYDSEDFQSLLSAMQVLGFSSDEQDTIFKILSSVLHLGNVYFHRKQLKHGSEGVEVGSDAEIKWCSHLLQISVEGILQALATKTTEARNERLLTPLNIDQALDARDAFAKALYSSLFTWLVKRINQIVCKGSKRQSIAILDIFGFEDFKENSFEQLCINYANETLQFHFNKHIFKLEQLEYQKEKINWQVITYQDNQPVINLIAKKPVGIFHLLDDESNFPKATDLSFLEKCHYNHALNELYSRPRMSSMEFGIKHYAGQVWYSVENFLDKNRDTLRHDVVNLLISSQVPMISKMFQDMKDMNEAAKTMNKSNGRFVTMKPRTPTVAARFHDSLLSLLESMSQCNPWFVRCIKPNNLKSPMKLDMDIVLEQLRYSGMLETIKIRKTGYPVRMKFILFADRFRCLLKNKVPKGAPAREICKIILERFPESRDHYQLGSTKIFLRESLEHLLEKERVEILHFSVITIQRCIRGRLARRRYLALRSAALTLQSNFRGYKARTDYKKIRRGVICAQANYRMKRQKREYHKLRVALARKREAEKAAKEKAKATAAKQEQERVSRAVAVAGVNHLEIPAELAFIFSKLDEWQTLHGERNVNKVVGNVVPSQESYRLPHNIDLHAFTKYINVYFKSHIWGMKREPIKTPFLPKSNEAEYQDSLAIFKLILRFMNDSNLSGKRETVLGDYVVQKGIQNEKMRDEILCQLCNQTWKNDNDANNERGWILMANCLSVFPPSKTLYKYLLKYVSDHAYNGYKGLCQHKLLQSAKVEAQLARTYPPSQLEWRANKKRANMALEAKFADGESMYGAVDSWTTGENFASRVVKARGIDESSGWTVSLQDDSADYELNGSDYVLDLVSEMEIPPAFPHCQSHFLVSHDRSHSSSQTVPNVNSPHRPDIDKTLQIEIEEIAPVPPVRRSSASDLIKSDTEDIFAQSQTSHVTETTRQRINASISELSSNFDEPTSRIKNIKESLLQEQSINTRSRERLTDNDFVLSKTSALNERYFDEDVNLNSVENDTNLLKRQSKNALSTSDFGLSKTSRLNERYESDHKGGLSETSRLNRRYMSKSKSHDHLDKEPTDHWEKFGLSSSSLNVGYFHQENTSKPAAGDVSDIGSELQAPSSQISDEDAVRDPPRNELGGIVDFPELEMGGDNDNPGNQSENEQDKYSRASSNRFVKKPSKSAPGQRPHSHSTKAYIETRYNHNDQLSSRTAHSSAMSDTSEAPSLASHVRGIRIPSHTSDLDQYLDDLFNPVLDGNIDDLSDVRSLAASIKGGKKTKSGNSSNDVEDPPPDGAAVQEYITTLFSKISEMSDSDSDTITDVPLVRRKSILRQGQNDDDDLISSHSLLDSSVDDLHNAAAIATALKGGSQGGVQTQVSSQPISMGFNVGAQYGGGGSVTSPPVVSPSRNMFHSGGGTATMSTPDAAFNNKGVEPNNANIPAGIGMSPMSVMSPMSYLPLYNVSGMNVPGGTNGQTVDQSPFANQPMDPSHLALQQQMFQRAFLASAVQQNFQIQQQLMQQNQALQQLIAGQLSTGPTSPPVQQLNQSAQQPGLLYVKTDQNVSQNNYINESQKSDNNSSTSNFHAPSVPVSDLKSRSGSVISGEPPPPLPKSQPPRMAIAPPIPPPPPPPVQPDSPDEQIRVVKDIYGREKTIRIGKWRWPPPRGEGPADGNESFFAFKMQKQHEKQSNDDVNDEPGDGFEGFEYREVMEDAEYQNNRKISKGPYDDTDEAPVRDNQKIIRAFDGESRPDPGSIGKLRISSEMKSKLEQLTMDHSVRSTNKDRRAKVYNMSAAAQDGKAENNRQEQRAVKKLAANRKALLEAQLSGSMRKREDDVDASPKRDIRNRPLSQEFYTEEGRKERLSSGDKRLESESREKQRINEINFTKINYAERHSHHQQNNRPSDGHHKKDDNEARIPRPVAPKNGSNISVTVERHNRPSKAPSTAASSSYYAPSTPVVPQKKRPPPPVVPERVSSRKGYSDQIEFEESSEFLQPVDDIKSPVVDDVERRTLESIKTKFYPPTSAAYFSYNRVPWEIQIRKEVFSPLERIENPLALHLVFCQIVQDTCTNVCIRIGKEERRKMRQILDGYGINPTNIHSHNHKTQMKKNVVEMARDWPNYFCRMFPVSGGRHHPELQLLSVSHSGVRLVRKEKGSVSDQLQVLEYFSFENISEVVVPRTSTVQILLQSGGQVVVYTHKANDIHRLLDNYLNETDQGTHDYVRAVADYVTRESTLLSFRKGDVIKVKTSHSQHLEKGWLYGAANGHTGIFPLEYVVPINRQEASRIINMKEENGARSNAVENRVYAHRLDDSWIESKAEHYEDNRSEMSHTPPIHDGKFSLLQFALFHFRQSLEKYDMLRNADGSIRGSIKMIESLKVKKKKGKKGKESADDWTWKEQAEMVKFTRSPIQASLLRLPTNELNKAALECFIAIMKYMGDYPLSKGQNEVDCVYTLLMSCHKHHELRDEVYCQIMKQTTNNKSPKPDSCQKGWRLFSILAAYFECSDILKPYLFQYLETAAYDTRRAYHGTAMVCLQNLRKTCRYGGRKNVPSIEEITAISAGRNSKRQMYRLPGGTERVINTKSTTIVKDIIEDICTTLDVRSQMEMEEFSLYCIVEGELHTMPLNRDEYILDVTTELLKNGNIFYLIFCRTVWYYSLRLDNQLYIEVNFNQIAPDYIEGLLLVMPGEQLQQDQVYDIARVAALLHRASDMKYLPTMKEIKYLLPKPVLEVKEVKPQQWVNMVQGNWQEIESIGTDAAKAQVLEILERWEMFGSCFFAVKRISNSKEKGEQILGLNKNGVHFLDLLTHETIQRYPFSEVISTRKVKAEDGTLFLDMKCGNLMVQKISRIQTDQAYEISRLIRQYINVEQRHLSVDKGDAPKDITLSR